jgi:hypothetical protein
VLHKPVYEITGWSKWPNVDMGAYVFSINLDPTFADMTRKFQFRYQDRFEERIREMVGYKYARATFLEGTGFLRSMSVEGNCACLGVSGNILNQDWSKERFIQYNGHNVDSKGQAYDLLSIFTMWIETMQAFTY